MELLRVAGATLNQVPLDWVGNRQRIISVLREAADAGVEVLCLPELAVSGYGCEDAFFSIETAKRAEESLAEILPYTEGLTVLVGLPVSHRGALFNAAAMIQDGRICGVNAKRVLPREGVHYEPRWFKPWPFGERQDISLCGTTVPLGDLRYRLGDVGVGVEICEEAWDSVPAAANHADDVDLILNPSASHFALGKLHAREQLVADSSRALRVYYVYANLLGLEAGRIIYDGGVLVAQGGSILKRGERFGFRDTALTSVDVNPELVRVAKLKGRTVRSCDDRAGDDRLEVGGRDPRTPHGGDKKLERGEQSLQRGQIPEPEREEEFLQAVTLGLFDYLRKAKAKGFVVSLSGGCDSSVTALAVSHMFAEALRQLGAEELASRLGVEPPPTPADPKSWIQQRLTCIYQKTNNSSAETEDAARNLARELGAAYDRVDVQPMVDQYTAAAEHSLGRKLSWEDDDVTLQNIQARARAPFIWMIANAKQALLLTTSNRSEAGVGYATMDGDTAGGLAPLGGIDKKFLRDFLAWGETKNTHFGLGPVVTLGQVRALTPTAELRPVDLGGKRQTDESDLMPYEVLERIERYAIRDRLGPDDILQCIETDFPHCSSAQLAGHIRTFFRLWAGNQWKRERLAPSFHLDDESLDPKTWCRYPILSVAPDFGSGLA